MKFRAGSLSKSLLPGLVGVAATPMVLVLTLLASDARGDLITPKVATPQVIAPGAASGSPAPTQQSAPAEAPAPTPAPASSPGFSGTGSQPAPVQSPPQRNPFDTDRPPIDTPYPSDLPSPGQPGCDRDRACLTTWWDYISDELNAFSLKVAANGGKPTPFDQSRDRDLTDALHEIEKTLEELDKVGAPDPNPFDLANAPFSAPFGGSDPSAGDSDGSLPDGSQGTTSDQAGDPSPGFDADPPDSGWDVGGEGWGSGGSGGGGGLRDEDDPLLFLD
jgi:hypothetical protein